MIDLTGVVCACNKGRQLLLMCHVYAMKHSLIQDAKNQSFSYPCTAFTFSINGNLLMPKFYTPLMSHGSWIKFYNPIPSWAIWLTVSSDHRHIMYYTMVLKINQIKANTLLYSIGTAEEDIEVLTYRGSLITSSDWIFV